MKKVIIAILSILFFALVVRADDAAKYRAFVDTIKAEVFATELTALKTKDIPENTAIHQPSSRRFMKV